LVPSSQLLVQLQWLLAEAHPFKTPLLVDLVVVGLDSKQRNSNRLDHLMQASVWGLLLAGELPVAGDE